MNAHQLRLLHIAVNNLFSPAFQKLLNDAAPGEGESEAVRICAMRLSNEMRGKLHQAKREGFDMKAFKKHLGNLAANFNITLAKQETHGLTFGEIPAAATETCRLPVDLAVKEYNYIRNALLNDGPVSPSSALAGQAHFQLKELICGFNEYMLARNSLNGGLPDVLREVWNQLIKNEPNAFFTQGYIKDFLIHDRVALARNTGKAKLVINEPYLSTYFIPDGDEYLYEGLILGKNQVHIIHPAPEHKPHQENNHDARQTLQA